MLRTGPARQALVAAGAVTLLVAGCGDRRPAGLRACLAGSGASLERTVGDQLFARFPDGARVGIELEPSARAAALLAPAANGPGDPYAYVAVDRAVVAWSGAPGDPHLRAVSHCLRSRASQR